MRIIRNAIKCVFCQHEVESRYRHDFKAHRCADMPEDDYIAADGGKDYLRRVGHPEHYIEISEVEGE